LAERVAEIAIDPILSERTELWRRVNRLERVRPPINYHVEELAWLEIMPESSFITNHPDAQRFEKTLRRKIWEFENLDDDRVVDGTIEYSTALHKQELGVSVERIRSSERTGTYRCVPVIKERDDILKINTNPKISPDKEATEGNRRQAEDIFQGILRVKAAKGMGYGSSFIDLWCELRGMDQVFLDMALDPDWTHEALGRLADNWENRLLNLQAADLLQLNNGPEECYNGGFAITDELPADDFDGTHVRLKDLWGFSTAQSFVSVSPEMHNEFIIQYEKRVLSHFGLNALACCEPMHKKLKYARQIPNLRRVSMSEWVDVEEAAKETGTDLIFSFKPTGTRVAAPVWDEEADKNYLRDVLEKTRGCVVEIVNNTISTCRGDVDRIRRWTKNAKELVLQYG
jgi:hypothetical protein